MELTRDQIIANREAWLQDLETTTDEQNFGNFFDNGKACAPGRAIWLITPNDPSFETLESRNILNYHYQFRGEANEDPGINLIANLNDSRELTFAEIAAEIRENPELYFEEV